MSKLVKPATRLDVVIKLREQDEERTRHLLAEAERALRRAIAESEAALARTRQETRAAGSAAEWQMLEAAHGRALHEAHAAAKAATVAEAKLAASRTQYQTAYQRAETIRRVADTRRAEIIAEAESKERKELDEVAVIRYAYR